MVCLSYSRLQTLFYWLLSSKANTLCTCFQFYRHFMLELISLIVNLRLTVFNCPGAWFIHVIRSFYSLESSVLSVEKILPLGRHAWRYKQRIHRTERHNIREEQLPNDHDPAETASRVWFTSCCCGKLCKGKRGLKMHQRGCRLVLGLIDQLRVGLNDVTFTDQEHGNGMAVFH